MLTRILCPSPTAFLWGQKEPPTQNYSAHSLSSRSFARMRQLSAFCRRARFYVAAIGFFSAVYNLPRFWEITWVTIYDERTHENITVRRIPS